MNGSAMTHHQCPLCGSDPGVAPSFTAERERAYYERLAMLLRPQMDPRTIAKAEAEATYYVKQRYGAV